MSPRSRQPNDFDAFADADQGLEESDLEERLAEDAEDDTFSLARRLSEAGSGADQMVIEGGHLSPADFSVEELDLARNLQGLFPLEAEQLPPRFIETLAIQRDDWAAPTALEQRVTYRVFRRLRLSRRLFASEEPVPSSGPRGFRPLGRAPRMVALSTLVALVLLSLVTVAPSFAQGLRVFLGQTGVQVAPHYPQTMLAPQEQVQYLSPQEVQRAVPFHVYWLGLTPGGYQFAGLFLHIGQPWADGPVVELQYHLDQSMGNGELVVREFRPAPGATVLQVVAQGAAHPAQVGDQPALYIDGQWVQQRQAIVWRYGTQAELLYQADGLIFWITADQRDGVDAPLLEAWAQSLEQLYLDQRGSRLADMMLPDMTLPTSAQVASPLSPASLGEVVALIPAGISPETGAAVYIALGSPPEDNL